MSNQARFYNSSTGMNPSDFAQCPPPCPPSAPSFQSQNLQGQGLPYSQNFHRPPPPCGYNTPTFHPPPPPSQGSYTGPQRHLIRPCVRSLNPDTGLHQGFHNQFSGPHSPMDQPLPQAPIIGEHFGRLIGPRIPQMEQQRFQHPTCPPSARFDFSGPPPSIPQNFSAPPPPLVRQTAPFDFSNRPPQKDHLQGSLSKPQSSSLVQCNDAGPKEKGKMKLDGWLQRSKKPKKSHTLRVTVSSATSSDKPLKVWRFTQQLSEMSLLLSEMACDLEKMDKVLTTADTATWEAASNRIHNLKQQHSKLLSVNPKDEVEQMERKLQKARGKRARLKRARKEKYESSLKLKAQWELKGKAIDAWQEMCTNELIEKNKKKARKAAADKTLSKVNKEIHDANKLIETMTALQKLRLVRRDAAEKRGDSNLGESRESFEEKIGDMIRLVKGQLEFYKEEEARLKTIIKSEVEESNKKEKESLEERDRARQEEEDAVMETMLFGSSDDIIEADPLYPFAQFYRQADHNLQAFLNIRHQWDTFLVPKTTPGATCVPSTWVTPQEPSSNVWASALK